jgi:hypothetical protein
MLFRGAIKRLRFHEGLLQVWVCLLAFKTIFVFRILPISSLGFALYVQNYACREGRYNTQAKQLRKQSKRYMSWKLTHYTPWKCTLEFLGHPFRFPVEFLCSWSSWVLSQSVVTCDRPTVIDHHIYTSVSLIASFYIFQILVEPLTLLFTYSS